MREDFVIILSFDPYSSKDMNMEWIPFKQELPIIGSRIIVRIDFCEFKLFRFIRCITQTFENDVLILEKDEVSLVDDACCSDNPEINLEWYWAYVKSIEDDFGNKNNK